MTRGTLTGSLRETLDLFREPGRPLTTTEVADRLDLGRRSSYDRLDRLVEHGRLETKKVGASGRVWWLPSGAGEERVGSDRAPPPAGESPGDALDAVGVGLLALDGEGRIVHATGRAATLLDRSVGDLLGREVAAAFPGAVGSTLRERTTRALDREEPGTFEEFSRPHDAWFEVSVRPTGTGCSVYVRDVTARREYERERDRYETIVETADDGIYVVDGEGRYSHVNEAYASMVGAAREELVGSEVSAVIDDEDVRREVERIEADLDDDERRTVTLEAELTDDDGDPWIGEATFVLIPTDDGHERVGVVRDVTERVAREEELTRRVQQQVAVSTLGRRALEDRDLDALLADATDLVAEVLDDDCCAVLDLDADAGALLLRQGTGWNDGVVGSVAAPVDATDSQAAYTLRTDGPVVVRDLDTETRFGEPALLAEHGVRSGVSTVIGPPDDPWGVLGTYDTARRDFSVHDVNFVRSVSSILASAIARHDYERKLVRQHEQLAALNHLNRVVRGITNEVIERSTREEIEATVCEHLADSESYLFAWIGEIDVGSQVVDLRTEAGVEGYLDGVHVSVDPDVEGGAGPTGEACRTGEIRVVRDIDPDCDSRKDRWRAHAAEYGFRSFAAVPVVHEGSVYGALNVYAERPMAFADQERAVLAQLGEVVGHAIAAAERKRTLMSDEVVELEFHVPDLFDALGIEGGTPGEVEIDHAVPLGDDEYRVYGRADEDGIESVRSLVETISHWQAVTVHDHADEARFELHLAEPPVLSEVAAVGGFIDGATLDDGDYRMTVHASPGGDVRRIVEAVEAAYPGGRLLRRGQIPRSRDPSDRVGRILIDDLTERQRTTLEAAYHAGYFAWPRDASGEEVAESLGIAPPTFHQHLRTAQRKAFGHVLSALPPAPP